MAILLQVGSAMCRGTIRCYIDTISGSSLRPAVSAVSLADSTLLDPIELTQILRPHSLARSRSPSPLFLALSLLFSVSWCFAVASLHSFTLAWSFFSLSSLFLSFKSCLLFLPIVVTPFSLPPTSALLFLSFPRILLFIHSSTRSHAFCTRFSFAFFPSFFSLATLLPPTFLFSPFFYLVLFLATVFYFLRL